MGAVANLLFTIFVGNAADVDRHSAVIKLDPKNFVKVTSDSPMTYILFYDPKCQECSRFNGEYYRAAGLLRNEHVGMFAQIDNTFRNRKIFDAFGLDRNYPRHNVFCVYTQDPNTGPVMTRVNPWGVDTTAEEIDVFVREHKDLLRHLWNFEEEIELKNVKLAEQKDAKETRERDKLAEQKNAKETWERKKVGSQPTVVDSDGLDGEDPFRVKTTSVGDQGLDVATAKSESTKMQAEKTKDRRQELLNNQLGSFSVRAGGGCCAGGAGGAAAGAAVGAACPYYYPFCHCHRTAITSSVIAHVVIFSFPTFGFSLRDCVLVCFSPFPIFPNFSLCSLQFLCSCWWCWRCRWSFWWCWCL